MQLSIAVGALTAYPTRTTLRLASEVQADGVEILLSKKLIRQGPSALQEAADEIGIPILSAHAILSFRHKSVDHQLEDDLASIRFAGQLKDCHSLVLHPPITGPRMSVDLEQWLDAVTRERDAVRPNLELGLENRSHNDHGVQRQFLDDLDNLRDIATNWNVGITYDLAHAASHGIDVVRGAQQVRPRLVNVHLSDHRPIRVTGPIITGLFRDHRLPGHGVLPIDDALDVLRGSQYNDLITLEFSPLSLMAVWPPEARRRLRRSVTRIREVLDGRERVVFAPSGLQPDLAGEG